MEKLGTVNCEIIRERYRAIDAVGADPDLLATIESWGDTLTGRPKEKKEAALAKPPLLPGFPLNCLFDAGRGEIVSFPPCR